MTTQYWKWSWVTSQADTKKASESIDENTGVIYTSRGRLSSSELTTSINSISTNMNHMWRLWNNNIRPILDSLPAGSRDTRWRPGQGLPSKIDALNYGLQGTTLFVFNDADSIKASSRYWHTTDERPITIAEALENIWYAIENITVEENSSSITAIELDPLWESIGQRYKDSSLTSIGTSLDYRVGAVASNVSQLTYDLYGANDGYTTFTFGVPLTHSVAENIDYLLKLHNVSGGWQNGDPALVSHVGVGGGSSTLAYTSVLPMPSSSLTQARIAPYTSLYNDILRIRYEIQRTRGSGSWYTDATDPVTSTAADLQTHIDYHGTASVTSSNPHGVSYTQTGASTMLSNLARYTGMTAYTSGSEMPTYSSTNYVTQSTSLETAIGALDTALDTAVGGTVSRIDYGPYDRTAMSPTTRLNTAITLVHNQGKNPVVQIVDESPDTVPVGQYSYYDTGAITVFPDVNTVLVYTDAAITSIVCLF